jgi:serpin B
MVILLPKALDGITDLEQALTAENLGGWLGQMRRQDVWVSIPKFTMTSEFKLGAVLPSMGMPLAFTPPPPPPVVGPMPPCADFTGMTPERVLSISKVIHKAYVSVNEAGTEAAAATAVVMITTTSCPVYIPFQADHPFIFLIRDNESGSILFLGRVMDPTA